MGYAVDHWLFYAKGGVAWASNKYSVVGTFNGGAAVGRAFRSTSKDWSVRTGWTAGGGVEWAFAEDWSARLEYDYYDFGTHTATMNDVVNGPGPLTFKTTMQIGQARGELPRVGLAVDRCAGSQTIGSFFGGDHSASAAMKAG